MKHGWESSLPRIFISSNEFGGGGGGKGRPLLLGNIIGTRPVPRVLSGKRPGGGGGKMELGARVKFGGGKRPNGEGKLMFALLPMDDGGNGRGHAELDVVVGAEVPAVATVVLEELSADDVALWLVDGDDDVRGLVLFEVETVFPPVPDSSVSVFSIVNVSVNRPDLEEDEEMIQDNHQMKGKFRPLHRGTRLCRGRVRRMSRICSCCIECFQSRGVGQWTIPQENIHQIRNHCKGWGIWQRAGERWWW